jgi:hypothetical protein
MTNYTIASTEIAANNKALVASTEDKVTFTRDVRTARVTNLTGSAAIYFTIDNTAATVAGANCYVIPAAVGSVEVNMPDDSDVIRLISSGTPSYSVSET